MTPEAKQNRAVFESFLQRFLPSGSDTAKYSRDLDRKIKAFYKKQLQDTFDSVYEIKDENAIYKIKQTIVSHPSLVYRRGHSADSRIEGLDYYLDYLKSNAKPVPKSGSIGSIRRSTVDMEGRHIQRESTVIQRNPMARRRCIEHYGCRCAACGLSMFEMYGELGEGVIEVHHLNPIHLFDDTHVVDYLTDLIPLCPNCHTMIHKLEDPGDIESLKKLIAESQKRS